MKLINRSASNRYGYNYSRCFYALTMSTVFSKSKYFGFGCKVYQSQGFGSVAKRIIQSYKLSIFRAINLKK